jgi:hypothetical protein
MHDEMQAMLPTQEPVTAWGREVVVLVLTGYHIVVIDGIGKAFASRAVEKDTTVTLGVKLLTRSLAGLTINRL